MMLFRLAVLYMHLLACCVAIGMTLVSDMVLIRRILTGRADERRLADMRNLQSIIVVSLSMLWITGLSLIAVDLLADGLRIFGNPKLQAKFSVCVVLTLNGIALHRHIFPTLQKAGSLLKLDHSALVMTVVTGAISAVSWFYAAFLGIARPLAWKYSLLELLLAYPILIVLAYTSLRMILAWSGKRTSAFPDTLVDIRRNKFQ